MELGQQAKWKHLNLDVFASERLAPALQNSGFSGERPVASGEQGKDPLCLM